MEDTALRQLQCVNTRTHEILLLSNTLKFTKMSRRFADSKDVAQLTRHGATLTLKQQLSTNYHRKTLKFVGQGVVPFTIDHVVLNRIVSTLHQERLSVVTTDM